MKDNHKGVGLTRFCRLLGVTRQAYYQHLWYKEAISTEQELVIKEVKRIRQSHRYMGTRKLYEMIQPFLLDHQIKIGRDALFDLLAANGMLVRRRKQIIRTTNSFHWLRKYPNLIKDFIPQAINQLWVSDITYWKLQNHHVYISFITDAFSHKIVGYHVADSLAAVETLNALRMALGNLNISTTNLIHHSDRGLQYCSEEYVKQLNQHQIKISMTETGDPLDNAIAERINGIIKNEYLCNYTVNNITEAKTVLKSVIELYNNERPHMSNGNLTPQHIHVNNLKTEKLWRNYYRKNTTLVNLFQDDL
jgi:putative transposase